MGHGDQHPRIDTAPAGVDRQGCTGTRTKPESRHVGQDLGEHGRIPDAKIEPLAGNGMNGMGGITHQGQPAAGQPVGDHQRKMMVEDRSRHLQRSQKVAEPPRQFLCEHAVVKFEHPSRNVPVLGPHDGGAIPRQRQNGEGTTGKETLVGDTVVRS